MNFTKNAMWVIILLLFISCKGEASSLSQEHTSSSQTELPTIDDKVITPVSDASAENEMVEDSEEKSEANKLETEIVTPPAKDVIEKGSSKLLDKKVEENREVKPFPSVNDKSIVIDEMDKNAISPKAEIDDQEETIDSITDATENAEEGSIDIKPIQAKGPDQLHETWDNILSKYVTDNGEVDYAGIKANIKELDSYLADVAVTYPTENAKEKDALAYWINIYNAFTVKLIIDNYPVSSITDINGGEPWDKEWITIGQKTYSLNYIEHKIIRPTFNDARIHFAVNCAAKSCPKLVNKAYTGSKLEGMLDKATRAFVNNEAYNQINANGAKLSKIFEWYKEDFGDLREYVNQYSRTKLKKGAPISFIDYNWALNKQ